MATRSTTTHRKKSSGRKKTTTRKKSSGRKKATTRKKTTGRKKTGARKKTTARKKTGGRKKSTGRKKAGSRRKYSRGASDSVGKEMHEYKRGTARSGPGGKGGKVKSRKQAIAIGLSKARASGKKVPRKKG
ncbi:MAG TPA: DUF6496 domain-containing protein [Candidatus Elarobacter sp.]|jgi:hypothetical protein|nr:DUF6496 domain-containing protein [Candidatus Elarobacter sp.]